ncbi:MAG: InlB B-repeat-containing protein [Paludibacteraceae bacterium]|nr:InlB B-repeat-containing protein [Paludibacteraceae bacterium]
MKKLFSFLCLLVLSAVMVVQAETYSFSWANTTITNGAWAGGNWPDRSAYRYVATTNGGYPKLYIYISPTNMSSYGSGTYPSPKTYSVLNTKRDNTPAEGVIYDSRYANNSSAYRIDFLYSNTYDLVKSRLEISSGNIVLLTSGSFTFAQGANGQPYVYSSGLSHTITIGEQLVGGTISAVSSPAEGGTATASPSTYQAGGSNVSLSATPNSGFAFLRWQDAGGNTISTTANTSVSVNGNATYTAVFATARTITVNSANDAQGSATGGGTFAEGATTEIRATANSGYSFSHWDDGNTDNPRSIIVSADKLTYTAYFEEYTSSMSIASCSSGADIEAHFDYSNVTTNSTDEVGVNDFTANGSKYCYVYFLTAQNSSNDKLTLYFFPEYIRTYQGGECTQQLSQTPAPNTYPLQKQSLYQSNSYDTWYVTKNTAFVYNYIYDYDATSPHCDIIMQNNSNKHWDLDAGGNIVVSQNNVGGLFIETENVTEDAQGQSVYFTLGNRSENTVNLGTGTMTKSGSNLTFNASTTDNNGRNYAAKIKIKQNTTGSVAQTNFDLNQSSFLYQDSYIEEIKSITGTLSKSGNTYTLSATIRDCQENVYFVTISATAVTAYDLEWNANGGELSGSYTAAGSVNEGASITAPTATKNGYTFVKWRDVTNGVDFTGTMPSSNVTYTAQWNRIEYTITYNGLEGATNTNNPTSYNVETETITLANPGKRDSYIFAGWKDKSDNTITQIAKGSTGNLTLTATWNVKSSNIELCENCDNAHYNTFKDNYNNETVNVTYNRQFTVGRWSTMCLPFNVNYATMKTFGMDGCVYEFKYATGNANVGSGVNLYFSNAKSIEAGKCYIVNANDALAEKTSFVFSGVTIDLSKDNDGSALDSEDDYDDLPGYKSQGTIELVGTLRNGTLKGSATGNTYMGLKNNKIYYPNTDTGSTIWAYRGIFRSSSELNIEKMRIIVDGEDRGELIIDADGELLNASGDAPSRKFIRDGVLYIEREGVVYDAQGKRVED